MLLNYSSLIDMSTKIWTVLMKRVSQILVQEPTPHLEHWCLWENWFPVMMFWLTAWYSCTNCVVRPKTTCSRILFQLFCETCWLVVPWQRWQIIVMQSWWYNKKIFLPGCKPKSSFLRQCLYLLILLSSHWKIHPGYFIYFKIFLAPPSLQFNVISFKTM